MRSALFGVWNAATFFAPVFGSMLPSPIGWILGFGALVVGLFFYPFFQRMGRESLCSTAWAREQGITPQQLQRTHGSGCLKAILIVGAVVLVLIFGFFATRLLSSRSVVAEAQRAAAEAKRAAPLDRRFITGLREVAEGSRLYFKEYGRWPASADQLLPRHNPRGIAFLGPQGLEVVAGSQALNLQFTPPVQEDGTGHVSLSGPDLKPGTADDERFYFNQHETGSASPDEPIIAPPAQPESAALTKLRSELAEMLKQYKTTHPLVDEMRERIQQQEDTDKALSKGESEALAKLHGELAAALRQYKPDHPQVVELKKRIEAQEAKEAKEKTKQGQPGVGR